jgi:signal transduction histidine kinase
MKTRTYLFLMLVALIVPVACLSIFGLSMLLQSERESRLRALAETAKSMSLSIDSEIAIAEASIRNVANSPQIATDDFAGLHRLLSATRTSPLSWSAVADVEGNGLLNTLAPYGTPLAKRTGTWAAPLYDRQRTTVRGYFVGTMSGRGVVSVNVPVPAAAGKKYVVMQMFDPRYFNKVFEANAVQSRWVVGVFDADGVSIARNRNAERFVGRQVRAELVAAARSRPSGVVRHRTREGIEVYDTFVRSGFTNWTVAVGVPVDEIESAVRMTTWYAALALLAVLSAAIAAAVFFGRRIDKSLRHATEAARVLEQGKVAPVFRSKLKEADMLLGALHDASLALSRESAARQALEDERTRLLDSERAARRQAEAHSEAKDHFMSMLSHELRNPLAAINGAVSVIRMPRMPAPKVDKAWDIVGRQLKHLTQMVEDLLDVRRVVSGKVALAKAPVDIGGVLRFCCESRIMATASRHAWTIETEEAWILGDRTRLDQIVDNLLVNAMKFTPAEGRITVSNRKEGATVVVEVADTGIGIAPDVLPTIFESLVQAPTAIDRSQGGLGLGLSIARGLVQMHGGSLTARSDGLGKGCVFTLRLPLLDESGIRPASTAIPVEIIQ